jgi:16S rRNA (adenine1518-N6/adenine1519-N6)-dimethyltransferase
MPLMDLTNSDVLMPILKKYGFYTKKGLGQHFLMNKEAVDLIVEKASSHNLPILEIGPGVGTVTRQLAETGLEVLAVEIDYRAMGVLREIVGKFDNVTVVHDDFLKVDLPQLLAGKRWVVVGNLPYYITSPIIEILLENHTFFHAMYFLLQIEVVDRLSSPPGSKVYSSLSVFAQTFAYVNKLMKVSGDSFMPPPRVDSAIVEFIMHEKPLADDDIRDLFFKIVRASFGQRRKTILNSLNASAVIDAEKAIVEQMLTNAGIMPVQRAETVGIDQFLKLAKLVRELEKCL